MQLVFLGTGAGCGVPSFYCGCPACQEAAQNPRFERTRCAVLLKGKENTLIDATPDLRAQLLREKIEAVDYFVLSHSHYDHTGGLGELEFFVRVKNCQALPAYMTPNTWDWLQTSCGYLQDCFYLQAIDIGWSFELDEVKFQALEVTHAPGTVGFLMETATRRTAYIPDTGPLPKATREKLAGIDTLILGATFWGNNPMPEDHLSVDEAVEIALQLNVKSLYLTHLSMHHETPITNKELEAHIQTFGHHIHLAYDGLEIPI